MSLPIWTLSGQALQPSAHALRRVALVLVRTSVRYESPPTLSLFASSSRVRLGMPDGAFPPSPTTATTAAKRSRSTSDITKDGEKGAEEGRGRGRTEEVRMVVVLGGGL